MDREFVSYNEIKQMVQNIVNNEFYEEILLNVMDDLFEEKRKNKKNGLVNYKIRALADALKEAKCTDEQQFFIGMITDRLELSI